MSLVYPNMAIADSLSLFQLGINAYKAGQYERAVDAFTQAIRVEQASASAYADRCLSYIRLYAYAEAINDCTQAIQLDSQNAESYLNRGLAYYYTNKLEAAILDFNRVLDIQADDYRAYYNRGLAQSALGHYQSAIADYNLSIQHSPALPDARMAAVYSERGAARLALHQIDDALPDLNQAIELNESDAEAYFNLGWLKYQRGNLQAAISNFHQAAHYFRTQGAEASYQHTRHLIEQLQATPAVIG
ncbi:MAG: tetratricopeptide repeat protein [Thainema sp.]